MRTSGGPASAVAASVAAAVLACGPLAAGDRGPVELLALHTVLAAAAVALVAGDPESLRRHGPAVGGVALFAAAAWVHAPYRYRALLLGADVVAAALLFALAARAAAGGHARRLLWAAGCGTFVALIWGGAERALDLPLRAGLGNPRHAASYVAAGAVVAAGLGAGRGTAARAVTAGLALLAAGFVVLEGARGAFLAAIAGLLVLAWMHGRRRPIVAVAAALAAVLLIPNPVGRRLSRAATNDTYAWERARIWRAGLKMAAEHWQCGGVGLGSFERVARRYNFPVESALGRYAKYPNHAHNEVIEAAAETGLAGVALVCLPFGLTLVRARRLGRAGAPGAGEAATAAAAAATLGAAALVDAVLHAPAVLNAFAALMGVVSGLARPSGEPAPAAGAAAAPCRGVVLIGVAAAWAGAVVVPFAGDRAWQRHLAGVPGALEAAIRLVPGHAGYRARQGRLAEERFASTGSLEDLDSARGAYEAAARLDPLSGAYRHALAGLFHRAFSGPLPAPELAEMALARYGEAIASDPFNPFLHADRAALLGRLGRTGPAERGALDAVGLEPRYVGGWELVATARRARGDEAGARAAEAEARRIGAEAAGHRPASRYEADLLRAGTTARRAAPGEP